MRRTYLKMSQKEMNRVSILEKTCSGQMRPVRGSEILGISYRQMSRLKRIYKSEGVKGLIHKNRGKESPQKIGKEIVEKILNIIPKYYEDFGPTLTCEKLNENHNIMIGRESVRQIMIKEGIWQAKKKKKCRIFQERNRREYFGELIQMDGSYHDWFEGRAEKCCLIVIIDDATGRLLGLYFCDRESTENYFIAMQEYIEKHGRPCHIYTDKHSIFKVNTTSNNSSSTEESPKSTQFSRALEELNIRLITANTPQAKGRVERANKTLQDRLIKEMRLKGISSIKEGNKYLLEFIDDFNKRFAVVPKNEENKHKELLPSHNLDEIFSKKFERILSKELSFQYNKTLYQIKTKRQAYVLRKKKVLVLESHKHSLKVIYKGAILEYETREKPQKQGQIMDRKTLDQSLDFKQKKKHKRRIPSPDHIWRRSFQLGFKEKKEAPLKEPCHTDNSGLVSEEIGHYHLAKH